MRRKASDLVLKSLVFHEAALRRLLKTTRDLSFRLGRKGSVSRHVTDAVKKEKVNDI